METPEGNGPVQTTPTESASGRPAPRGNVHYRVIHDTPGRMRIRIHPEHRTPEAMHQAHRHLMAQDGVTSVQTNLKTGSVLVHYSRQQHHLESVMGLLEDVGMIAVEAAGGGEDAVSPESHHSSTATALLQAVGDLDDQLSAMTGRRIDLRILVPIGLAAAGVILAVAQGGIGLTAVPPFLLLWFAFDAFLQLHRRANDQLETGAA